MRIAVISDSHGRLPAGLEDLLAPADHILHLGDVGPLRLLDDGLPLGADLRLYLLVDGLGLGSGIVQNLACLFAGLLHNRLLESLDIGLASLRFCARRLTGDWDATPGLACAF